MTAWIGAHWTLVCGAAGAVCLFGAVKDWDWLANPAGKPDGGRYSRGERRLILGGLGVVLLLCALLSL